MVASLDPQTSPPKLILSSLRTLNTMLDTYISPSATIHPMDAISAAVYTPEVLSYIKRILLQSRPDSIIQQQIGLAASLFAKSVCTPSEGYDTCETTRKRQQKLVDAGILYALATRLVSFYVDERKKQVKPENLDRLPPQAPPTAKLAPILQAIAVIIQGSKLHGIEFLFSPALVALFPYKDSSDSVSKVAEGLSGATSTYMPQGKSGGSGQLQGPSQIITPAAFPPLSAAVARSGSPLLSSGQFPSLSGSGSAFFPLASYSSRSSGLTINMGMDDTDPERGARDDERPDEEDDDDPTEIEESELVVRLISQVRTGDATTRVAAASVLTNLFTVGLVNKKLHSLVSLLVIPVLVRLLDGEDEPRRMVGLGSAGVGGVDLHTWNRWQVQESAPAVLARLVVDDKELRKAAVEASAIHKLAEILNATCDSISSSESGSSSDTTPEDASGKGGPHYNHRQRVKDGVLRALANLALAEEKYRKQVIEAKVVKTIKNHCLRSLAPLPSVPLSTTAPADDKNINSEPNTPPVLVSACSLIRSISRSVYILRTDLIDAEIGVPIFNLLQHPSIEVRIAAAATLCNIVLDFSPMRAAVVGAGAIDTLCRFAKGDNHALQLESLWALKHLVKGAQAAEKEQAFDSLGGDYLMSIISHVTPSSDTYSTTGSKFRDDEDELMSDDLADYDDDAGSDTPRPSTRSSAINTGTTPSPTNVTPSSSLTLPRTSTTAPLQLPPKAAALASEIRRHERHAQQSQHRRHLISLQELALGFLSNLLYHTGDKKPSIPIINHILPALSGASGLFTTLTNILSPSSASISTSTSSSSSSSCTTSASPPPPPEIIEAVVMLIVNFAGCGNSRHRSALCIENTPLMDALRDLERCERAAVRSGICWLVINLTSVDEEERGDPVAMEEVRQRVRRLRETGWVEVLRRLAQDPERDVQERVKAALAQIEDVEAKARRSGRGI